MANLMNLTGNRYGYLTVISFDCRKNKTRYWLCKCDCGKMTSVSSNNLRSKEYTKSCGCYNKQRTSETARTHGKSKGKEYDSWDHMKRRCGNPKDSSYKNYGQRGIKVCDRWLNSFENFFADMGPAPSKAHTLERLDNNLGYDPNNCKWATRLEQVNNTRRTRFLTHDDKKLSIAQWAELIGIHRGTIENRLRAGLPIHRVLSSGRVYTSQARLRMSWRKYNSAVSELNKTLPPQPTERHES